MDVNGHMNYRHYLELATDSLRPLVAQDLGFGEDYVRARSMGSFVAEHRIRYLAETLVGDRLTGHVRLARQSRRSFTVTVILLNRTSQCLSYALAATYVHVDLVTRRSIPFPPDVERLISASRRDW